MHLEDDPFDAELINEELISNGLNFELLRAESKDLFEVYFTSSQWDVILSDFVIPGYGGFEALEFIRSKDSVLPFIFVSGKIGEDMAISSLHRGADDYVLKDKLTRLVPAIQRSITQHREHLERLESERLRKESERKLSTLVNNLPGVAYRCLNDEKYTMLFMSEGMYTLSGYRPEEVIEGIKDYSDLIYPDDMKMVREKVNKGVNEKAQFTIEYRIVHKSGEIKWVWEKGLEIIDSLSGNKYLEGFIMDITERKLSETKYKLSEKRLSTVLNSAEDVVFIKNSNFIYTYVNPALEKLYQLDAEDILGKKDSDIFPEAVALEYLNADKKVLNGKIISREFTDSFHGTKKTFHVIKYPLTGSAGDIEICGIARDISQRKDAEEKLVESSRMLETIFDSMADGLCLLDKNLHILQHNKSAEELLGSELTGKNLTAFIKTSDYEYLIESLQRIVKEGYNGGIELTLKKPGDILFPAEVSISALESSEGTTTGFVTLIKNITERKNAENLLRINEERLKLALESAGEGIWEADIKKNILYFDDLALKIMGIEKDNFDSNFDNFITHIYKDDRDKTSIRFSKFIREGKGKFIEEYRIDAGKGGIKWIKTSGTVISSDSEGRPETISGIIKDITSEKEWEERIKKSESGLAEAQSIAQLGNFLYDPERGFLECSRELYVILGFNPAAGLPDNHIFLSSVQPEDRLLLIKEIELSVAGKGTAVFTFRYIHPGGKLKYLHFRAIPVEGNKYLRGTIQDITEIRTVEEALQESEQKFRILFEKAPAGIALLDLDDKIISANSAYLSFHNLPEEEYNLSSPHDLLSPDEQELYNEGYRKLKEGKLSNFYFEKKINSGEEVRLGYSISSIIRSEFNSALYIIEQVQDITEIYNARKQLSESEEKYRLLANNSHDLIWTVGNDLEINFVSPAIGRLYGYSATEFKALYSEKIKQWESFTRLIKEPDFMGLKRFEIIQEKKDAGTFWAEITLSNMFGDNSERIGILAITRDITQKKTIEIALKISEREKSAILNSMTDIVAFYNTTDLNIMWTNRAALKEKEYADKELADKKCFEIWHKLEGECEDCPVRKAFNSGKSEFMEIKSGEDKIWRVNALPVFDDDGQIEGVVEVSTDITQIKEAENSLKESREVLRNLAKHNQEVREEERTRISREIHDDLGQALTAFKIDIDWIERNIRNIPEEAKKRIIGMKSLATATIKTVQKISSDLRPEVLDELGLLPALEWEAQEFAKRTGIEVSTSLNEDIEIENEALRVDIFRIFQEALTNIARHSNARNVVIYFDVSDKNYILKINDDGIGIDKEKIHSHKSLGLTGIRERLRTWSGDVVFHKRKEGGTEVIVSVPALKKDER